MKNTQNAERMIDTFVKRCIDNIIKHKLIEKVTDLKSFAKLVLDDDSLVEYIEQGIRCDNMSLVSLDKDVVIKVNKMAELTNQTPQEVVNEALRDQLEDVENIPREIDYDKLWDMLDHDKPEGDDILDNLARLGEEGWD